MDDRNGFNRSSRADADKIAVNGALRIVVEDAKHLIRRCQCSIQLIVREGNMCADKLANLGANQDEPLVVTEDAPDDVRSLVVTDLLGIEYQRS